MPPRSLASLAHALGTAADLDGALVALGEVLADIDRTAVLALLRYDARRAMLVDRRVPDGMRVRRDALELTLDHLPESLRDSILGGTHFVDLPERSGDWPRLFGFTTPIEGALLSLRGLRVEGQLAGLLALHEPRKIFGTRTSERLAPALALFDLAFSRLAERDAREEAVRTLEDVTQRVHGEYVRRLRRLELELRDARTTPAGGAPGTGEAGMGGGRATSHAPSIDAAELVALQAETARAAEEARRAVRRADITDQQLVSAVSQLEQAHVELHRRSEALRQRTRTLWLLDRVLTVDATTRDPRELVHSLLRLVGDDMQAQRCSLMLIAPEPEMLYLAAARGLAPNVTIGMRTRIGEGVSGRVAAAREPIVVQDVAQATKHPLLRDQYFTTGSFISFPLVYHGELVGVVNLTNRAQRGIYVEDDVERVRLLGLVISLIASHARLAERLATPRPADAS